MRNRGLCWSGRISYGSVHAYRPKLRASLCPSHAFHPLVRGCRPLPAAAQAVTARNGMVVAQEARAAQIGVEMLEHGGNAVDAAVAVGFALAVTYPRAGNIGGGGFMVIHLADGNRDIAIDYRETAPAATTRDIFLDEKGEADPRKSRDSALGDRRARHGRGACAGASSDTAPASSRSPN